MYSLWQETQGVFLKPKVIHSFGWWRRSLGLPVWRHGPVISFWKYNKDYKEKLESSFYKASYEWTDDFKERHPFISKVLWPVYNFPIWLSFRVFNIPTIWKTKYEYYRYEFPGQFTIVLFGYSFNWFAVAPVKVGDFCDSDGYYESMLWFIDGKKKEMSDIEALKYASRNVGFVTSNIFGCKKYRWCLSPEYVRDPKLKIQFRVWQEMQEFKVDD